MGGVNKYSGLLFCADCGAKMYFYRKRDEDPKNYSYARPIVSGRSFSIKSCWKNCGG